MGKTAVQKAQQPQVIITSQLKKKRPSGHPQRTVGGGPKKRVLTASEARGGQIGENYLTRNELRDYCKLSGIRRLADKPDDKPREDGRPKVNENVYPVLRQEIVNTILSIVRHLPPLLEYLHARRVQPEHVNYVLKHHHRATPRGILGVQSPNTRPSLHHRPEAPSSSSTHTNGGGKRVKKA